MGYRVEKKRVLRFLKDVLDAVGKIACGGLDKAHTAPLCSVEANDSHDDKAKNDGVIDHTGGHNEYVVDEPERDVDRGIEAAYRRVFLNYCDSEEPRRNAGENIKGVSEIDHRNYSKAYYKDEGKPHREIFFLSGKDEADNSLNYAEEDNAASGCRTAEYSLRGE